VWKLRLVAAYRLGFAVLAAVALGWQAHLVAGQGRSLANFFSYFTIESNILGVLIFVWGGVLLAAGRPGPPDVLRGAVVVYLLVTGVVYALLLSGIQGDGTAPWVNTVVHQVMPVVVVLDWLFVPPVRPLPVRHALWWLVFPLLYLAYTLIRGPLADFYPYPFLDPRPHGYGHALIGIAGVAIGFVLATLLVRWTGAALGRRLVRAPA
jgi:hypothetical protein